jgi:hypothetical protein
MAVERYGREYFNRAVRAWRLRNPETAALRAAPPEIRREYSKRNREKNRAKRNEEASAYYYAHRQERRAKGTAWRKANPGKVNEATTRRRGRERRAMPAWADLSVMAEFYARASDISRVTGVRHVVDHIAPLRGRLVSGLHVGDNFQILTNAENLKKGRRWEP